MIAGAVVVGLLALPAGTGAAVGLGAEPGSGATAARHDRVGDAVRGGEARDALRLSVTTNGAAVPPPRVRAGAELLRTYRLANRAEYPLTGVSLEDPELHGGRPDCGRPLPLVLRGLEELECRAKLSAAAGDQVGTVTAHAQAPAGLPDPQAVASVSYHGVVSGLRFERLPDSPRALPPPRSAPLPPPADVSDGSDARSAGGAGLPPGSPGGSTRRAVPAVPAAAALDRARAALRRDALEADRPLRLRFSLLALGEVPLAGVGVTDSVPGVTAVDCPGLAGGGVLAPGGSVECTAAGQAVPGRQSGIARAAATVADHAVGEDGRELPALALSADANSGYDGPAAPSEPAGGSGAGAGAGTGAGPGGGAGSGSSAGGGPGGSGGSTVPGTVSGAGAPGGTSAAGSGSGGAAVSSSSGSGATGLSTPPTAPLFGRVPASAFAVGGAPAAPTAGGAAAGGGAGTVGGAVGGALSGGAAAAAVGSHALIGALQGAPYLPGLAPVLPASPFRADTPQEAGSGGGPGLAGPGRMPTHGAIASLPAQLGGRNGEHPRTISDDVDPAAVMWLLLAFLLPVICVLAAAFAGRVKQRL